MRVPVAANPPPEFGIHVLDFSIVIDCVSRLPESRHIDAVELPTFHISLIVPWMEYNKLAINGREKKDRIMGSRFASPTKRITPGTLGG